MVVDTQLCIVVKIHGPEQLKVIKNDEFYFFDLYFDKGDKTINLIYLKNKTKPLSGSSFMTTVRNCHSLWIVPVPSIDLNIVGHQ